MGLTRPRAYQIFDIDYKQAVRVVQTSNVTLAGGAPAIVDGVSLSQNDRVLVTGQSTASQNGLYYVTTVGTGSNGTWARSIDGNETGEIQAGLIVMVTQGTSYADTQWKLTTDDPIVVGTTPLTFVLNVGSIVGGLTTQVQFNDGGVLGATAGLTFDKTSNALTAAGNITGSYFIGNGSQLTGLPAGYANANVVAYGESGWAGNLIPSANVTYSLGNTNNRWKDLWISNSTIYIGETNITASGSTLIVGGSNVVTQTASGNITGGNVSVTGNISAGNISITGTYIGNGYTLTSVNASNVTGTVANATYATSAGSATSATTAGTVTTAAQPNITSVGTLSSLTVTANVTGGNLIIGAQVVATGNITGGNLTTAGILTVNSGNAVTAIVNAGGNGIGNIGSSTTYFNTVFAKATSAQYADLAEMYVADGYYPPGHVVVFGGDKEITLSTQSHDTAVAGIISTNPSYLMNSTQSGEFVLAVALTGRVPCLVQGPVNKGDVLVTSSTPGTAQRIGVNWQPGCTVGKAMEDINESIVRVIEVAVGRL